MPVKNRQAILSPIWHLLKTLLVCVAVLAGGNPQAGQEEALAISIHPHAVSFSKHEAIDITVSLNNNSGHQLMLVNRSIMFPTPELSLVVADAQDKELKWLPPIPPAPISRSDFDTIEIASNIEIELKGIDNYLTDKLGSGIYTIKAIYTNSSDGRKFGLNAWTGSVISNDATFSIE